MAKGITLQELDASALVNLVPHLGTTSNSGDAYRITTSASVAVNQKFTIKFNAASSSAPTLKINNGTAYPIKKPNGNNAKVYASVYSLFWDGTNFILQGEGGEYGTATAADVLEGKTIGTENGVIPGTLKKGKQFASGTITAGTGPAYIPNQSGTSVQTPYVSFDFGNIPFVPSTIEFTFSERKDMKITVWRRSDYYYLTSNEYANVHGGNGSSAWRVPYSNGVVSIPATSYNGSYDWIAYE